MMHIMIIDRVSWLQPIDFCNVPITRTGAERQGEGLSKARGEQEREEGGKDKMQGGGKEKGGGGEAGRSKRETGKSLKEEGVEEGACRERRGQERRQKK